MTLPGSHLIFYKEGAKRLVSRSTSTPPKKPHAHSFAVTRSVWRTFGRPRAKSVYVYIPVYDARRPCHETFATKRLPRTTRPLHWSRVVILMANVHEQTGADTSVQFAPALLSAAVHTSTRVGTTRARWPMMPSCRQRVTRHDVKYVH